MALTFKSIGKKLGRAAKKVLKPATVAGLTLINPGLGAAAAKALALKGVVKTATSAAGAILRPPAMPSPSETVAVHGAMPVSQFAPPESVPAMPWVQFRGIMWEAYQKGLRGEVLT